MKLERLKRRTGGSLILELTPLIDVVFLLLIFFMLATTFNENTAFKIELPQTNAEKNLKTIRELQILIDKEKKIFLKYNNYNSKNIQENLSKNTIVSKLKEKIQNSESKVVIVSADKSIDYGFVIEIIALIKEAGAETINLDTEIKR